MKKPEKKKLDEIAKAVVKADAIAARDLEKIIANPALFEGVRARIAAGNAIAAPRRSYFRPAVASFASVTLVAAAAFGVLVFRSKPADVTAVAPIKQVTVTPVAPINESRMSDVVNDINKLPPPVEPVKVDRIATRPSVRTYRPKQAAAQQVRYEGNFYALSYAGDPHETERGGRIVRVDIPRSTLFAMGVNIPLENEREMVKTDLLIGPDGVTRAIRVVE